MERLVRLLLFIDLVEECLESFDQLLLGVRLVLNVLCVCDTLDAELTLDDLRSRIMGWNDVSNHLRIDRLNYQSGLVAHLNSQTLSFNAP